MNAATDTLAGTRCFTSPGSRPTLLPPLLRSPAPLFPQEQAFVEAVGPSLLQTQERGSFRGERRGGTSFFGGGNGEGVKPPAEGEGGAPVVKGDAVILRLWGGVRIPSSEGWR